MEKIKAITVGCSLNDLLFPVELNDNPRKTNSEYSKVVTGIINGEEMDLNYCSDRYRLIPNGDIFPNIEDVLISHGINYQPNYRHINNVRFYADYTIQDDRYAYRMKNTTDLVYPMLNVQHSYNGLTKYKIVFGYFRLVCSNGLVIPIEEMKKYNLFIVGKHTEQIVHSFKELNIMLSHFGTNAKLIIGDIVAKYELLGDSAVTNMEDRIKEVLNATKIKIVENSKFNTIDVITNIVKKEANDSTLGYGGTINDWLIYNGINQYINSDRTIAAPEIRAENDSKVFEYMLQSV